MVENGRKNIFIDKQTTNDLNVTFLAVINKEKGCTSYI